MIHLPIRVRCAQWRRKDKAWAWYTLDTPLACPVPRDFDQTQLENALIAIREPLNELLDEIVEPSAEEEEGEEVGVVSGTQEMKMLEQDHETDVWWLVIVIFWNIGYRHSPPVDLTADDFLDGTKGPRICQLCGRTQLPAEIARGVRKMRACRRCHQIHYCSTECADEDWPDHAKTCPK